MSHLRYIVVMLSLAFSPFANGADDTVVTSLMSKELGDIAGKEVLMLVVEYPAGGADPVHRHDAHGFIYVLEGTVVMQVRGGKECDPDARTDFLRGTPRRSYGRPECKSHRAGEVSRAVTEGQGR